VDVETSTRHGPGQDFTTGDDAFATLAANPDDQIMGSHLGTSMVRRFGGEPTDRTASSSARLFPAAQFG
jgi:hypothetical protein